MSFFQALAAYVLWGIFPIYWKMLRGVNSTEVICHRILWSVVTLIVCVTLFKQWSDIRSALRSPRRLALVTIAALLISCNWLVFIWAVQHGAVVESSLGYFINPLLNVMLGVVVFKERLSRPQWVAVGIAALGLLVMTIKTGTVSWIALTLATTFAVYAAVKKQTSLPAVAGLGLETAVLAPIALGYLCLYGKQSLAPTDSATALLLLAGPVTTLPLVLFAAAAKVVPLGVMGILQYVAPSLQFIIGIALYREPLDVWQLVGFGCVWIALAVLTASSLSAGRQRAKSS